MESHDRICPRCNGSGNVRKDEEFGAEMRGKREAIGMKLRAVAKLMGLSPSFISGLEKGSRIWTPKLEKNYLAALGGKSSEHRPEVLIVTSSSGFSDNP
jgi:transcriptional regulator with XRE-family HTH domain